MALRVAPGLHLPTLATFPGFVAFHPADSCAAGASLPAVLLLSDCTALQGLYGWDAASKLLQLLTPA
jgi:hypothetical protein